MKKIKTSTYWDGIASCMERQPYYVNTKLGNYKQWEFLRVLNRWCTSPAVYALKTDSFEEAFGSDSIIDWLLQKCRTIVCLDISPGIIMKARIRNNTRAIQWTVTDINAMPFHDNTFNLIFSSSTYGYLNDIHKGLQEAYRILKPKGTLIISINNRYNIFFRFTSWIFSRLGKIPFPLSRPYTPQDLYVLLEEIGFHVNEYEPIVHITPFMNSAIEFLRRGGHTRFVNFILTKVKKYSLGKSLFRYATSWFIVFNAQKP